MPSTTSARPIASEGHCAFSTNQLVDNLVTAPMMTNTLMKPADTAVLTFKARSTEARSAPGRRFSIPRK
jgi:hypothetical protein